MPRGDGTGPLGQGPGTGRGMGQSRGAGRGRMGGNRQGSRPAGNCVCPICGTKVARKAGILCVSTNCPKCGTMMMSE